MSAHLAEERDRFVTDSFPCQCTWIARGHECGGESRINNWVSAEEKIII